MSLADLVSLISRHRAVPRQFWMAIIAGFGAASLILFGAATAMAQQQGYPYYVANTAPPDAYLALRSEPSSRTGQRLMEMPNDTRLEVLTKRPDGWWLVKTFPGGMQGWALSGVGRKSWILCCKTGAPDSSAFASNGSGGQGPSPNSAVASSGPATEILVYANLKSPDVAKSLNGGINLKATSGASKDRIAAAFVKFDLLVDGQYSYGQTLLQAIGGKVAQPRGSVHYGRDRSPDLKSQLLETANVLGAVVRAFKSKNPSIKQDLELSGSIDRAALIFVPQRVIEKGAARDFQQRLAAKNLILISTLTVDDIRAGYTALKSDTIAAGERSRNVRNAVLGAAPDDTSRYGALAKSDRNILRNPCVVNDRTQLPEARGLLLNKDVIRWIVNDEGQESALGQPSVLQTLDEIYAAMVRPDGQCTAVVAPVGQISTVAKALVRDGISFDIYPATFPASDLRFAYAKSRGFNEVDEFNLADAFRPMLSPATAQELRRHGVMTKDDWSKAIERMKVANYSRSASVQDVIQFLEDERNAALSHKSPADVRESRLRATQEAQAAERAQLAQHYPYQAIIVCGSPQLVTTACFTAGHNVYTDLELRNGDDYGLYKIYQISQLGRVTPQGRVIDLREHFEIKMQNASEMLTLSLRIIDTKTGKEVFRKDAGRFDVLSVRN